MVTSTSFLSSPLVCRYSPKESGLYSSPRAAKPGCELLGIVIENGHACSPFWQTLLLLRTKDCSNNTARPRTIEVPLLVFFLYLVLTLPKSFKHTNELYKGTCSGGSSMVTYPVRVSPGKCVDISPSSSMARVREVL